MADLVRIATNDISATGVDVEQAITNDDADIKNLYSIMNKVRGMYYGPTAPQSPNLGDKWDDSATGKFKRWDGDSFEEVTFEANGGNADTVAGHEPGTGANDILLLDGNGKAPENILPYSVPIGAVIMWTGTLGGTGNKYPVVSATPDTGWHVCDGTDGTVNMQGLFPIGANGTYALNSTGGETTHTLTTGEMPAHTHTFSTHFNQGAGGVPLQGTTSTAGTVTTSSAGSGEAHNNMPPYRAIHFIQRIA
jgi:hypothetical protein